MLRYRVISAFSSLAKSCSLAIAATLIIAATDSYFLLRPIM